MRNQIHPCELFRVFGLDLESTLRLARSPSDATRILDEFKLKAKNRFRELMLEHHPDRGGNEDKAKYYTAMYDLIKNVRYQAPCPIPQHVVRVVVVRGNSEGWFPGGYGSATSTSSSTGW